MPFTQHEMMFVLGMLTAAGGLLGGWIIWRLRSGVYMDTGTRPSIDDITTR